MRLCAREGVLDTPLRRETRDVERLTPGAGAPKGRVSGGEGRGEGGRGREWAYPQCEVSYATYPGIPVHCLTPLQASHRARRCVGTRTTRGAGRPSHKRFGGAGRRWVGAWRRVGGRRSLLRCEGRGEGEGRMGCGRAGGVVDVECLVDSGSSVERSKGR